MCVYDVYTFSPSLELLLVEDRDYASGLSLWYYARTLQEDLVRDPR